MIVRVIAWADMCDRNTGLFRSANNDRIWAGEDHRHAPHYATISEQSSTRTPFHRRSIMASTPEAPEDFTCPITLQVMVRPLCTRSGRNFERSAILEWIGRTGQCPLTRQPMSPSDLIPNRPLELRIKVWRDNNGIKPPSDAELDDSRCLISFLHVGEVKHAEILARSSDITLDSAARDQLRARSNTRPSRQQRSLLLARI